MFKVGDKVICIDEWDGELRQGTILYTSEVAPPKSPIYGVLLDEGQNIEYFFVKEMRPLTKLESTLK